MERVQKIQKISELRKISGFIKIIIPLLLLTFSLFGCASTYPSVSPDSKKVELDNARWEIPESLLIDVRIQVFDPGELPSGKNASHGLSEGIRKAESQYMAVQLKKTLQATGYWGAVRVVPGSHPGNELMVTGRILKSNGEELKLKISAFDAMGQQWFDKTFKGAVSEKLYEQSKEVSQNQDQPEVFQNVYNRIANELAAYRQAMISDQVQEIRHVAEIQFAEDIVPTAFAGYLRTDTQKKLFAGKNKLIKIDRLPSDDDEMFKRVQRVRERDYTLVDMLDAQYEDLYRIIQPSYTDWRHLRVQEMNMIREVDAKKNKQKWKAAGIMIAGAALGAVAGDNQGYNPQASAVVGAAAGAAVSLYLEADKIGEEAEINKAALEELGVSFASEVKPTVLNVEGETITLSGTAEAKYKQWREVLARLYKIETEAEIYPEESNSNI